VLVAKLKVAGHFVQLRLDLKPTTYPDETGLKVHHLYPIDISI
jgi:hypothetical protein